MRCWVAVRFEDYGTGDVLAVEESERAAWDVVAEEAFECAARRRENSYRDRRETWAQSVAAESYVLAVVAVGAPSVSRAAARYETNVDILQGDDSAAIVSSILTDRLSRMAAGYFG